jgi:hypothetical protein
MIVGALKKFKFDMFGLDRCLSLSLRFQNFQDVCHFQNGGQDTAYKWGVKIQHCPISSKFDMWVDSVSGRFGRLHNR